MLQTFSFDGGGRLVNMMADYFRYESASSAGADQSLRLRMDGQDLGTYLPGDAIKLPARGTLFELTPVSPACSGVIRLGLGSLDSARLVGTVNVVDESQAKTLAGNQFIGSLTKGAIVAKVSLAGIQAVTKTVVVRRLVVESATSGSVALYIADAAPTSVPSSAQFINKKNLVPASDARRVSGESNTTSPTSVELPGGLRLLFIRLVAGVAYEFPITTPLVLVPGKVLVFCGSAVNTDVSYFADIEEE